MVGIMLTMVGIMQTMVGIMLTMVGIIYLSNELHEIPSGMPYEEAGNTSMRNHPAVPQLEPALLALACGNNIHPPMPA
jgi:hypothetical protein